MSSCNGKCGSCDSKNLPATKGKTQPKQVPISRYLESKPKPNKDTTPLDHLCKCVDYLRNLPRYACVKCIKSWVEANNVEDAIKEVDRLKGLGKSIASERVHDAIEEKRKRNLFRDSCCKDEEC